MHRHNNTPDDKTPDDKAPHDKTPDDFDPTEASEIELIQHLARHLRRGSAIETAPWGLSPHQARALGAVARSEGRRGRRRAPGYEDGVSRGLRMGGLAGWLQVTPRSATEVVDALETQGLVARTADPDDRRAVFVGLTDQGREIAREIRTARKAQTETLLEELSETDRAQLRTSLLTLLEAAAR
ncbi:MarR family winged helix-turn-helix transcriptional regulator [Ornithinimicrobium faecis]|uniref:MarR family winged helix-turn-helix transcriptional regulator n=1 Tax=Ornithinimicrobium faecis TaxID=2934158 RepID=UPI0021176954|nr:MarR family winged helix-turn-helix transcriptional regulator [Ornithinimicrobium sp. HY1745]